MAVTRHKSKKVGVVPNAAIMHNSIPRNRSKTQTKGREFTRPTRASKSKQVTQASASLASPHSTDVLEQGELVDGANCESIALLKNLAKLLVVRIDAACAARNARNVPSNAHISNPNMVRNTAATGPHLLHGINSGFHSADGEVPHRILSMRRRNASQEAESSCQSQENGSNVDVDTCAVYKDEANSSFLSTENNSEHLGVDDESSQCIKSRNRGVRSHNARPCTRGECQNLGLESHSSSLESTRVNPGGSTCEIPEDIELVSRSSSRPNPGGSICDTSETLGPESRPSSRPNPSSNNSTPPTREWTKPGHVASMNSRTLTLNKVNVGLDDCEMPPKKEGVHPTPRRKLKSPGLRSLVVPQVKSLNASVARAPANTKLILSSSPPMQKPTGEIKGRHEPPAYGRKNLETEELYESVWADVVRNVFDEVFGAQEKPSHTSSKKQAMLNAIPRPPRASQEWIIQTQSIKYSYSSEGAASGRAGVHTTANMDNGYPKVPGKESRSMEASNSTQCSTRLKQDVSCREPPVILPTLAKYHMDKIERYKKCVAEKLLRERPLQQECRPSTAPDPYNVLNVYTERCASQKYSRSTAQKSEHNLDCYTHMLTDQPNSIAAGERAPTKRSPRRRIMEESCRAMSAGSVPRPKQLQNQQFKSRHTPEVDRQHEKSINLHQETRSTVNSGHELSSSEIEEENSQIKNRTTSQKQYLNGAGEDQHFLQSRRNLQAHQATENTEAISKKTKFMDYWPFLDRQIEAFIQAHILQCCILFKNIPPVFPTLEYQDELQRLYSGHPLST